MITDSFLEVKEICRKESEIEWHLKKVEGYATALFDRFCPFKVGDRVRLTRTPEITTEKSWGWIGSKHFLMKGALATVADVDYRADGKCFEYLLKFDDDSWIDRDGIKHLQNDGDRALFTFFEKDVEAA